MTASSCPVRPAGSSEPEQRSQFWLVKWWLRVPRLLAQGTAPSLLARRESPITMDYETNAPALAVTQAVTFAIIDATGGSTPLEAELQYDLADPYAVTIAFTSGQTQVSWRFSRDLLTMGLGLYTPSGDGDVHIWPCFDDYGRAVVMIELCSPAGDALVEARAADLNIFVERMSAAVPPGTESAHVDVDAMIAAIFAGEAA